MMDQSDSRIGREATDTPDAASAPAQATALPPENWEELDTEPYVELIPDKQDDIFFVSRDIGWYGNGLGRIFMTRDGGDSWTKLFDQPGTFVRALGFIDEKVGVFGNLGPESFSNVTDATALYRTEDGGRTWQPITQIEGPAPAGICAIDVLRQPFVNSARLDYRITLRAGGRVNGPAHLLVSKDLGLSWRSEDMSEHVSMILDVKFLSERIGFIAGASDSDISESSAVVIMTDDGGQTWRRVYQSPRSYETTWKLSFPSRQVGYVTIQNYNPDDDLFADCYIAKTVDGGATWQELPLVRDRDVQELGIEFLDERRGWVGALPTGYRTGDGGLSWAPADMGRVVNKFRIVRDGKGTRVFAIGAAVRRLDLDI